MCDGVVSDFYFLLLLLCALYITLKVDTSNSKGRTGWREGGRGVCPYRALGCTAKVDAWLHRSNGGGEGVVETFLVLFWSVVTTRHCRTAFYDRK